MAVYNIIKFFLLRIIRKLINSAVLLADQGKKIDFSAEKSPDIKDILLRRHLNKIIELNSQTSAYQTILKSRRSYSLFAQARIILILLYLFQDTKKDAYLQTAKKVGNYLLANQKENKLFAFNNPFWVPEDEGIMTSLAIICLTALFLATKEGHYLEAAENAAIALRKNLYTEGNGYVHTAGQSFWCINVSVAAAYGLLQLYLITAKEKFREWARDGYLIALRHIGEDDLFPYSGIRPGMYLSSYHAISLYYLIQVFRSGVFKEDEHELAEVIHRAGNALQKLKKKDGSIIEPDIKMDAYINSHAAAYAALSFFEIEKEQLQKIKANINKFIAGREIYLYCLDDNLFWSYHRFFRDVITMESLLWLMIGDHNLKNSYRKIQLN